MRELIYAMSFCWALNCLGQGANLGPEWTSIKLSDEGRIELAFQAQPEHSYVIESSINLVDWKAVSEPLLNSGTPTTWGAPESNDPHRFYRLVVHDRAWMKAQFERNRLLWNEQDFDGYTFRFNWSCFCPPDYTAPVDIRVEQGGLAAVSYSDNGTPVAQSDWDRYRTIEALFEILDEAFEQDAKVISVSYEPDFGYPSSVFIDYSELIADEERGFEVKLQSEMAVQLSAQAPASLQVDPFQLLDAQITGDLLEIQVEYGGGCRSHIFEITAHPSAFLESEPVQMNVHVSHQGNNDLCKALIRARRVFSLKPLKEAFQEIYPSGDQLILNIHGFMRDGSTTVLSILYKIDQ